MPRTKHLPVSSFGPELLAALKAGAKAETKITFATHSLATRFRQRVNALRLAMKAENHPDWEHLYRAAAYIPSSDRRTVVISPRDSEFLGALSSAGLTNLEPPPTESPPLPTTEPESSSDPADSFLSDLHKKD